MLVNHIELNNVVYNVGDKLKFVSFEKLAGFSGLEHLPINDIITIQLIKLPQDKGRKILIGIVHDNKIQGWHNLDDQLSSNRGYWIEGQHLYRNFKRVKADMIVGDTFSFKRRDLKNMKCKVISPMPGNKESIVEFEEDVGGCGADGLGKAGYCLVIPNAILSSVKKKRKSKPGAKKKPKKSLDKQA